MNEDQLNNCHCCKGSEERESRYNRPGQPAISYRLGTHSTFLQRMIDRISRQRIPPDDVNGIRPLSHLSTRSQDDPAIALMDAWAVVADVLTFYQERIANEGFLGTATERRSVLELARAVGYELRPGVAASTVLAFTVEEAAGSPKSVTVPVGTKVMSVPGQGEMPQTFETVEEIEARAEWNTLYPQRTKKQVIEKGARSLKLKGIDNQLQVGDVLLFIGDYQDKKEEHPVDSNIVRDSWREYEWERRTLLVVDPDIKSNITAIELDKPLSKCYGEIFAMRQRAALFGNNAPDWSVMPLEIKKAYDPNYDENKPNTWVTDWPDIDKSIRDNLKIDETPTASASQTGNKIYRVKNTVMDLDAVYPKILPESWIVLEYSKEEDDSKEEWLYRAKQLSDLSKAKFTLSSKVTQIEVHPAPKKISSTRETMIFAQSERLEMAEVPRSGMIEESEIELDHSVKRLVAGKRLIISGKKEDVEICEEVELLDVYPSSTGRSTLKFKNKMGKSYDPSTVVIYSNVALATHGETVHEVLGSGDGAQANQKFVIKKPPLTYLSAPVPSGALSTMALRVDDVLWQEAPSLHELEHDSSGYILRMDNNGKTSVIFGDGLKGARPPTGMENIVATYRSGIGLGGEVASGKLTLLQTRPLGIRGVTNPLPASGGADPESISQAKKNATLTVQTLDRIVSLRDFENFARSFAGIGKAQAGIIDTAQGRLVHITVASASGEIIERSSNIYKNLVNSISNFKDPMAQVLVDGCFRKITFSIRARILVDRRYIAEQVLSNAYTSLRNAFSFENRQFGQPATAAGIISIIQAVKGVIAVDILKLEKDGHEITSADLEAESAHVEDRMILPAEILLLNTAEDAVFLEEWKGD